MGQAVRGLVALAVLALLIGCAPSPPEMSPSSAASEPTPSPAPTPSAITESATPEPTPTPPNISDLPADQADVAQDLDLTEWAGALLAATEPVFTDDAAAIRDACQSLDVPAVVGTVGGCFTSRGASSGTIYVYRVDHPELAGTHHAVFAHELLHAVWHQLEPDRRDALETDLKEVFEAGEPAARQEILTAYRDDDPRRYVDELHSYIGVEVANLPTALEEHYATVFRYRDIVVAFHERSNRALRERESDLERREAQLEELSAQIAEGESELKRLRDEQSAEAAELDRLRPEIDRSNQDEVEAFNRRIEDLNAAAEGYERRRDELELKISQHGSAVEEYNRLAQELNDLYAQRAVAWEG